MQALALSFDETLRIPAAAHDLQGFREWVHSEDFPETGRIDFLDGELEAERSEAKELASRSACSGVRAIDWSSRALAVGSAPPGSAAR